MIRPIAIVLLLGLLLVPASTRAEQPGELEADQGERSSVLSDQQARLLIYDQGRASSALPRWWHDPVWQILPVKQVVQQGPLGQRGVKHYKQLPNFQYLTPRGPIIGEEEPLLGIDPQPGL